jgi:hypothetical protein
MSKSVLVICSSPEGTDYPDKDNQDMLDILLKGVKPTVDFLPGVKEGTRFPEDVPKGKLYDIVLFAGCAINFFLINDFEKSTDLVSNILKKNGLVVIVESHKFIINRVSQKHYDTHKHTLTLENLISGALSKGTKAAPKPVPGLVEKQEEFDTKIAYWKTKFKSQQTKKDKYYVYLHAKQPEAKPAAEDRCEQILEKLKKVVSKKSVSMKQIQDTLNEEKIEVTVGRRGTVKKTNTNTSNINALSGEEACKDKLRAIKIALQDTAHSADERLKEIRRQAGLEVRQNKTAKASSNSNSNSAQTPEVSFFDGFDASLPVNRDLASLNEVFKTSLLGAAVYKKEVVEKAPILRKEAEETKFSVERGNGIKKAIIRKIVLDEMEGEPEAEQEAEVKGKIAEEAAKSLEDFRRLYRGFAGGCEDVKITLECMHASGNNSDCFFHSFFGATCGFYRMAKVKGKAYNAFVTRFRQEIMPKIIDFFFAQDDRPRLEMSAEQLKQELAAPGAFLPDELYTIITYYYDCAILLIRPAEADGIRVGALIGQNTDATYGISNSAGVHFESLRIKEQDTYRLNDAQAKCMAYSYSQLSGSTSKVNVERFKEMGKVVPLNKPGADGAIVYDEAAMLAAAGEQEPGDVTKVYMGIKGEGYNETKTRQVRKLEEIIGRLTKNYKDRGLYQFEEMSKKSQNLEESIQVIQEGIVDQTKGDADIAAKEALVVAFVARLNPEQMAEMARKERAAKKAAKKGKKGGRRTVRKQRRGRKTSRA